MNLILEHANRFSVCIWSREVESRDLSVFAMVEGAYFDYIIALGILINMLILVYKYNSTMYCMVIIRLRRRWVKWWLTAPQFNSGMILGHVYLSSLSLYFLIY